jgi:hypothetical protein
MIIVENSKKSSARSEELRTNDLEPYQENTEGPYVTASLKADVLPLTFVIGDGKEYNSKDQKYFNQPLTENSDYVVFLRFFENQVNIQSVYLYPTMCKNYVAEHLKMKSRIFRLFHGHKLRTCGRC